MIEHLAVFLGSRDGSDPAHVQLARGVGRQRADAFLTLPGGLGTLEEFFELWTHQTLAVHGKPSGLLNPHGFWDPLLAMLDHVVDAGFADRRTVADLVVAPDLDGVLTGLERAA